MGGQAATNRRARPEDVSCTWLSAPCGRKSLIVVRVVAGRQEVAPSWIKPPRSVKLRASTLGEAPPPRRRMLLVRESYCATRSRSSLHTEAPSESLRERPDQAEAGQATAGVQIEAEPLVLHTELI
jgi:hypothetical protein